MPNEETTKIILEFPASNVKIELGTTITFDNISGFLNSDRVTYNDESLTEEIAHLENDKADKATTYTKTQSDNRYLGKTNPSGTGYFSLNRSGSAGANSVSVGWHNVANAQSSFAEGEGNTSSGYASHSEGYGNAASGLMAHAEGVTTESSGYGSHSEGVGTIANHIGQHVFGAYNVADPSAAQPTAKGNYIEIVGNGTDDDRRRNARTLDWGGNETLMGDLTYNGNKSLTSEISRLDGKIDNLPAPMIFKGTLGVGGTIQSLPTASASNEGWTYKVITDGTYAEQTAKVGDVFTSNGSAWVLIPSGDEDNDTWRAIKVEGVEVLGNGISSGAVDFVGSENIEVDFDGNGNKVGVKTKNIYTKTEVDNIVSDAIYNVLPDDTASGSVANFNTSLELPIKSLGIDVNAVQASGTPTPNSPKAISGWSEISLAKCGVNLWDEETENGYLSSSDGSFISHANSICSKNYRLINPSAQVYVATSTDKTLYICWYDEDKAFISRAVCGNTSVTSPLNARYFKLSCYNYGSTYNNDTSVNYPSNDTTYHAYNATTEVINLGGTYYGGHFTQDKDGKRRFKVTHNVVDLGNLEWSYYTLSPNYWFSNDLINTIKKTTVNTQIADITCECLPKVSSYNIASGSTTIGIAIHTNGTIRLAYPDMPTTVEDLIADISGNKFAYPIAEPYTINLLDGQPIITLNGTNNIYADTGDTSVVFKSSVNDYVSAHSGGNLLGMGGVYLGGAKSGGSEEEPDEGEDTEKTKLDDPKEEVKTIGDMKKLGGE